MKRRDSFRLQYNTNANFLLTGSWEKGGVSFTEDKRQAEIILPPLPFGLAAVLIIKARYDAARSRKAWVPKGFLTTDDIYHQMKQWGCDPEKDQIIRYVYNLRNVFKKPLGVRWTKDFFEWHTTFGYRLSTPPDCLHLHIHKPLRNRLDWLV